MPPPGAFLERAGLAAGALEKGPGLYGVPLPADSFSPSDARHASPMSPISP
jgi:hypothetical protein